ncbi:MAG: type II CAAX prenyl endopeptidase Rce1 family protein [Bacteroidia bacterium]
MLTYLQTVFLQTFRSAEQESADYMARRSNKADVRILLICILCALNLTIIHYFQDFSFLFQFLIQIGASEFSIHLSAALHHSPHEQLWKLAWWASLIIFFYLLIPAFVIRFGFRENLNLYGFRLQGAFKDIKLYGLMLVIMIPLVLFFSGTQSFQARYPFYQPGYKEELFPDFVIWELLYFLQFISLEFFFRGFILHGLRKRFGFYSIFVMTIPYCLIHFGKPFPETVSAILAGIILGFLSLKSKSVYLGIAIHYSVALTMDLCALGHKGYWNHF